MKRSDEPVVAAGFYAAKLWSGGGIRSSRMTAYRTWCPS